MAFGDISITSSARSNLLSLQSTAKNLSETQGHLATGKKVNSALDNATSYFQSQGFLNRASDLTNLKDSLATGVQTIASASNGITGVTAIINQLQGVTNSALQTSDTATRNGLAVQFNGLLTQLNQLVSDSTFNGTNLLNGSGSNLTVYFNETNTTSVTISGVNILATGLSVSAANGSFASNTDIQTAQSALQTALTTLRTDAATFGNNNTVVSTRQDFTNNLINTLQTASDNLVLADSNQEAANLQALQTRQQLGVISLGISNSSSQAILRLF